MKKLLLGTAMSIAVVGGASAADLYTKAPPPFSWTGCYLGGQVGYAWGRDFDSEVATATGLPSGFTPANAATPTGFKGGGYLGCNYQTGAFVFGVEGDVEGANVKGSTTFTNTGTPADFYETKINSEASIRGRIGYAVDRALLYVTGGVAFAHVNEHDVVGATPTVFSDNATTKSGWTVGGGIDYAFTGHWIGRIEYRYADFGTFSYVPTVFPAFTENHKLTENVIRAGLAYKF
jgi:outer membrane immunogenic protein